jgi:glycosyltransferase involved in cell wall biosynthesis
MLSIIIPTYHEEKYIGRLLESIKKQSLQPDEIIVADNYSTDKTREIAEDYGCKIVDGGNPAKGRNAGAKAATGDLLLFLDADNLITKRNFIENFVKSFKKRDLDVATTFITFENMSLAKIIVDLGFNTTKVLNEILLKHFNKVTSESGACILMKKELFDTVGQFDSNTSVQEDSKLFQRLSSHKAKYGLVGINLKTSDRRFKKMSSKEFTKVSMMIVYAFFRRFFGLRDSNKFLKDFEELYGPLGGIVENSSTDKE